MSGGDLYELSYKLNYYAYGAMGDRELDLLVADLGELLEVCDRWREGDTTHAKYMESVAKFKSKWLAAGSREPRLRALVEDAVGELRSELLLVIGEDKEEPNEQEE